MEYFQSIMLWSALASFIISIIIIISFANIITKKEKNGLDTKNIEKVEEKVTSIVTVSIFIPLLIAGLIEVIDFFNDSKTFRITIIASFSVIISTIILFYAFKFKKTAIGLLGLSILTGLSIFLYYAFTEYVFTAIAQFGKWLAVIITALLGLALILASIWGIIYLANKFWEFIFDEFDS